MNLIVLVENFRVTLCKKEESLSTRCSQMISSVASLKIGKTLKSARQDMFSS